MPVVIDGVCMSAASVAFVDIAYHNVMWIACVSVLYSYSSENQFEF